MLITLGANGSRVRNLLRTIAKFGYCKYIQYSGFIQALELQFQRIGDEVVEFGYFAENP